jgi:site-specific DNA-methyltransferase (adenine-specific)
MRTVIITGDARTVLGAMAAKSMQTCVTSPPYWQQRNYGVHGQIGMEPTMEEYIAGLCDVFDGVHYVLRDDGTLWVVIGDTYSGTKDGKTDRIVAKYLRDESEGIRKRRGNLPEKCLCQIPARFAIEMTARGWILRNEIIWHKPNAMPSSVRDRFTPDFEKVFLFSKSRRYYFKQQLEPFISSVNPARNKGAEAYGRLALGDGKLIASAGVRNWYRRGGRNKRTVWTIPTSPSGVAHYATFPEKLIETPILAGCPEGGIVLDPFMGAGTTAIVSGRLGRNFVGIELNPEYVEIAKRRIHERTAMSWTPCRVQVG